MTDESPVQTSSKVPLFKGPHLLWSDDKCLLDGKLHRNVPLLVDKFGIVIPAPSHWLLSLTTTRPNEKTVSQYAYHLRIFWEFLGEFDWTRVNDSYLRVWCNEAEGKLKTNSNNARHDTVIRFYRWAQEFMYVQGIIGATIEGRPPFPIRLVAKGRHGKLSSPNRKPVTHKPRLPVPSSEDVDALYERLSLRENIHVAARDCLMADWAVETGLRRAEFLSLTKDWLPSESKCEALLEEDRVHNLKIIGKGGTERWIPVLPELVIKTHNYIKENRSELIKHAKPFRDCGLIFISEKTGCGLSLEYVSRLFSKAFTQFGVKLYVLHRLRARFASKLVQRLLVDETSRSGLAFLREETILNKAALVLGHKNLKTLRHYLDFAIDKLERNVK